MSTRLHDLFQETVEPLVQKPRKRPAPLSVRVTTDERKQIEKMAGDQSLNRYIRSRILKDRPGQNGASRETLARLLAELGGSEIAPNLRMIAKSVEIGALILDAKTRDQLNEALTAIITLRAELIKALKR